LTANSTAKKKCLKRIQKNYNHPMLPKYKPNLTLTPPTPKQTVKRWLILAL
jgi:hypothetical protein